MAAATSRRAIVPCAELNARAVPGRSGFPVGLDVSPMSPV